MNGVVTGHRDLGGRTQTVMATINNTAISWIRNGIENMFNNYLTAVCPSSIASPPNFTIDSELITPSAKSDHTLTFPVRVYFTVDINDSEIRIADNMMLYADINTATSPDISGYKQMNDAFKDAQYTTGGLTKLELNDPKVFVSTIICKA